MIIIYNERSYGYDLNGNLLSVEKGVSSSTLSNHNVDLTSLTLVGNQDRYAQTSRNPAIPLRRPIIPPANAQKRTAYSYDAAGNHVSSVTESRMTDDDPWLAGDTEFEAQYNRLNLPSHRQGISEEEWTVYSADGVKQALYHRIPEFVSLFPALFPSTPEINWRFDYAGNYIFRDGVLDRILTPGGHIDCSGASPSYQWWLTDHLGNVRVVAGTAGPVVQTSHYDPYGGDIAVGDVSATPILEPTYLAEENLFRFGGKEWSKHFSDYDFGARYYSTAHYRFSTMDPLAEKYYNLSPYAYCGGNPVRYVDLFGMEGVKYDDGAGGYIIESNIVVLTEEAIQITDFMTERERKSAERKNLRIERRNDRLISTIQQSLESTFINSKGENGENVSFHFNVIPVATSNPFVSKVSSVHELSTSYGIAAYTPNRVGFGEGVALATVISQASTYALGETKGGILICLSSYAPSTIAHEIGHTLHLTHPIGGSACGLMHYPPESLSSNEVSIILQNAFQKK